MSVICQAEVSLFLFLSVPPNIRSLANITSVEGASVTLVCLSEGDPEPSMTFRKVGNRNEYRMGDNVSRVNLLMLMNNYDSQHQLNVQSNVDGGQVFHYISASVSFVPSRIMVSKQFHAFLKCSVEFIN